MRISLNSFAIFALLGSVPFASIVRSYPTGYIDVVETSKRGISPPKPPPRDPSHNSSPPKSPAGSDPVDDKNRVPSPKGPFGDSNVPSSDSGSSPSPPGSPPRPAAGFRNFAEADLKLPDTVRDALRTKGQQYITDLDAAISKQDVSKKVASMEEKGYQGQGVPGQVPELKIPPKFDPFGEWQINIRSSDWVMDDIVKPGSKTIVKTYEDPSQKAMIISKSYNNVNDPGGALGWTEMVMSNWHSAATSKNAPVSDLKYIIRNNIQKPQNTKTDKNGLVLNTRAAMNKAFEEMEKKTTETLTLDFNTENKVEMQQISILSAQIHVARVLQMLKDYRGEFKDLKITKLHLQHSDNPQSDSQHNIVIELGR